MLWGGVDDGGLELRNRKDGGAQLHGRFPYNRNAVLSDGGRKGRPRKERVAPRAFRYRIETPSQHGGKKEIHLLSGHDYAKPLASVRSGTLSFTDSDEALRFDAVITPEVANTAHGSDVLALIKAGLALGISPGFRLPPERAVKKAEEITDEEHKPDEGMHRAVIRTILDALLYEFSIVTRPAYPEAQIEERNWVTTDGAGSIVVPASHKGYRRWKR